MANTQTRDAARTRAQSHFAAAEQRDETVKQIIAGERAALEAKTAKLRALRLAKEAQERETADAEIANAPSAPATRKRAKKAAR